LYQTLAYFRALLLTKSTSHCNNCDLYVNNLIMLCLIFISSLSMSSSKRLDVQICAVDSNIFFVHNCYDQRHACFRLTFVYTMFNLFLEL
jgi:hypothetical protein